MLIDIIKMRCERLICAIFKKQKVTIGDAAKSVSNTLYWLACGLVIFLLCGFCVGVIISDFLDIFNLTPAVVTNARNSMSMLGIVVFTSLYGAFICASTLLIYQLTHTHARKILKMIITSIKNISNIKLAEDLKRQP